jgi:hypothetical protein
LHVAWRENSEVGTNKLFQFNDRTKSKSWSKLVILSSHITA